MQVEYSSNNSGGRWWLTDEDWSNLEKAGWVVEWYKNRDQMYFKTDEGGRWLGALAGSAVRYGLDLGLAIDEWETITHQNASALGCNCCGPPHSFSYEDGDQRDYYSPHPPSYGMPYRSPASDQACEVPL